MALGLYVALFLLGARHRLPDIEEVTMRKTLAIFITLVILSGMSALLSACNTTAGAGQDISATGDAITKSADRLMR